MPSENIRPSSVAATVETVLKSEEAALRDRTPGERASDVIANFAGTFGFVVFHLIWLGFWTVANTGWIPGVAPFDPYPFALLSNIVSVEAVLLTAFVLIKQNRMSYLSDRRAHLALQINLLTEREATRVLQLTEMIAHKLEVDHGHSAEQMQELTSDTEVQHVIETIDHKLSASENN